MKNDVYDMLSYPGAHFMGYFKNGQAVGNFWIGLANNGFLHGVVDKYGHITGENICFIYPDGITALCGIFENTYMKNAKHVEISEYGCDKNGLLEVTKITEPIDQYKFFYDPPTNKSWGGGGSKEIHDPYEIKNVVLKQSSVPNSGEGVYAIKNLPANKPAAFFSTYLYNEEEHILYNQKCTFNTSKSMEYRRACKKYSLKFDTWVANFGLPPESDINPFMNLGPKVNHHFL